MPHKGNPSPASPLSPPAKRIMAVVRMLAFMLTPSKEPGHETRSASTTERRRGEAAVAPSRWRRTPVVQHATPPSYAVAAVARVSSREAPRRKNVAKIASSRRSVASGARNVPSSRLHIWLAHRVARPRALSTRPRHEKTDTPGPFTPELSFLGHA